jgi:hypothetical protein
MKQLVDVAYNTSTYWTTAAFHADPEVGPYLYCKTGTLTTT